MGMDMNMSEIPLQQKIALGVIAVIGLYMFYSKVYSPLNEKITKTEEQLQQKQSQLVDMKKQAKKLKQLEQELKELEDQIKIAEKKLPEKKEIPQFIRILTDMVTKYGMDLTAFQEPPSKTVIPGGQYYQAHPYEMNLTTDYHTFGLFFSELVQLDRIFSIGNLKLMPVTVGSDQLVATFMFVAYTFNQ